MLIASSISSRGTDTVHRRLDDGTEFPVMVTTTRTTIGDADYHIGTVQDIAERKEYEKRLLQQRDNLETLNRMVRHDIRNDLQLVSAYAELVEDNDPEGAVFVVTLPLAAASS